MTRASPTSPTARLPSRTDTSMKNKTLVLLLVTGAALAAAGTPLYLRLGASTTEAPPESAAHAAPAPVTIVCTGRVEAIRGELDVAPQVAGQLVEVRVREGDAVAQGAVLDGARQAADLAAAEADVRLAQARLAQLESGNGAEEIAQARAAADAVQAEFQMEERTLQRARQLFRARAASGEDLDQRTYRAEQLRHQHESLHKKYEALRRGARPQEIDVARAELKLAEARLARARVEHEYRLVRAPAAGPATPVVRLADPRALRVRVEIDETHVWLVQPGLAGTLEVRGLPGTAGRVRVETLVPVFGPKRLFSPD